MSPGYYSKKLGEKLDKKREYYKQRSRTIAFKRRRIALKKKRKLNDKTNYFREGTQYSSNMELQEDNDSEFIPVPAQIDNSDNIVVFDIETTGLSRNSDIVQIAATDGVKTFNCFIAPRQPICAAASAITGLTFSEGNNQLYKNGKRVDCTAIHKGLLDFMAFLKSFRKPVLVGHNIISFDIPVLYNRLQEFQLCQAFMALVKGCIDTLKIARRTFTKAEVGNHKQETLVKKLLKKSYNAHDAQEDVNLLFELFTKKLDNYGAEDLYAFNYHAVLNSYKEMTSKKVLSVRSSQILAQAGIGLNHLRLAHKRDEKNGIRIILKENHVPVKSIDLIIEHLSSEE